MAWSAGLKQLQVQKWITQGKIEGRVDIWFGEEDLGVNGNAIEMLEQYLVEEGTVMLYGSERPKSSWKTLQDANLYP